MPIVVKLLLSCFILLVISGAIWLGHSEGYSSETAAEKAKKAIVRRLSGTYFFVLLSFAVFFGLMALWTLT